MGVIDPALSKQMILSLWSHIDPQGAGIVEFTALHETLAGRFGKDKTSAKAVSVVDKVIARLLERAGSAGGIKGLSRYAYVKTYDAIASIQTNVLYARKSHIIILTYAMLLLGHWR